MENKAYLLLEDGKVFEGKSFGDTKKSVYGVLACDTSMMGYEGIISNPSNINSIVLFTYPIIGSYGICTDDMESDKVYAKALIAREFCDKPSNYKSEMSLLDLLNKNEIPAICDIDTRSIKRYIRDNGKKKCAVIIGEFDKEKELLNIENYKEEFYPFEKKEYKAKNEKYSIAMIDLGAKKSIINALLERNISVTTFRCIEKVEGDFDGYVISNGREGVTNCEETILNIKDIISKDKPILAIESGHIALAKAMGLEIDCLPSEHCGASHPVKDLDTSRVYITTQNHSLIIKDAKEYKVSHKNLNDGTIEGIVYNDKMFSVAFYVTSNSESMNTGYIFDKFENTLKVGAK